MKKKKQIEVLAPAGSLESMRAAIQAGADAVYMGGTLFGARAYADNPELPELLEAIDYVHLRGKRIYLTVNTLLKERELSGILYEYLAPLYEAGVDALLIQDLGVWEQVRRWFPGLPLHASTQMTVSGLSGALAVKAMGGSRAVLSRELSVDEIRRVCENAGIEIEVFVHGALCYSYSGQCLFSSLVGGRSGNRGRCAQPCRLPYSVWEGRESLTPREGPYLMNLKDLCGLDSLGELLDAGVDSLKIEGRMKSPRYTAGVVSVYRRYVDRYLETGSEGLKAAAEDRELLRELFDRGGLSDGYFHRHNGRDMLWFGEKPRRQPDQELLKKIDKAYIETERKEKIKGFLTITQDLPATLSLQLGDVQVTEEGDTVLPAKSRPVTAEELSRQVKKLGNTPFELESLSVDLSGRCFIPMGAVSELRRRAAASLMGKVLEQYRRPPAALPGEEKPREHPGKKKAEPVLSALVEDEASAWAVLESGAVSRLYLSTELLSFKELKELSAACASAGTECFLALPRIIRTGDEKSLEALSELSGQISPSGFLIRSIDGLSFMKRMGEGFSYVADHSLYTFNRAAREVLSSMGFSMDTAPLELSLRELSERGAAGSELIVYGRLPMMVSAQCVKRNVKGCDKRPGLLFLKDRKGKRFPVRNYCRFCYNVIYNSEPLWLADETEAIRKLEAASFRLQFTTERPEEILSILKAYERALKGEEPGLMPAARTKGHFRRGVE